MEKSEFLQAMMNAGRDAMTAKLRELFDHFDDRVAATYTDNELSEVLWGFHAIGKN